MTVATQSNIVTFLGDGVAGAFPFPFPVFSADHLLVFSQIIASGAVDTTYSSTDFQVSGLGNENGGTLNLLVDVIPATHKLIIARIVPYTQDLDVQNEGGFYPDSIERQLDLTEMQIQQLREGLDRSLKVPMGESIGVLPTKGLRAGTYLGFDAAGNIIFDQLTINTIAGGAFTVTSRNVLAGLVGPVNGQGCYVLEDNEEGWFEFSTANLSTEVTTDTEQNNYVAPTSDISGASGAWVRKFDKRSLIIPEMWGAIGDGDQAHATRNTQAFEAMCSYVESIGAAIISFGFSGNHYVLGQQDDHAAAPVGLYRYTSHNIIKLDGVTGVELHGNGCKFSIVDNLRHGAFNADGTPMASVNGYVGVGIAQAYLAMIYILNSSGIIITGFELDGNSENLIKGGPWGDTGYQIGGNAVLVDECSFVSISNIYGYFNPADGIQIGNTVADILTQPPMPVLVQNCVFLHSGRQGGSFVGGKGITCINCTFGYSGRLDKTTLTANAFRSAPASAINMEAELGQIDDTSFIRCNFLNGHGPILQFVAAADKINRTRCQDCVFVGDNSWALWNADGYSTRYNNCIIVGRTVHPRPNANKDKATQFHDCTFTDDPAFSSTAIVFDVGPICDQGAFGGQNVLYDDCYFRLISADCVGPFTGGATIFRDCIFEITSAGTSFPQGAHWYGVNKWTSEGTVDHGGAVTLFGDLLYTIAGVFSDEAVKTEVINFGTILAGATGLFTVASAAYGEPMTFEGKVEGLPHWIAMSWGKHVDGPVLLYLTNHSIVDIAVGNLTVVVRKTQYRTVMP